LPSDVPGEVPKGAVPLAAAIAALREELLQACWDGQRQSLRFRPSPVQLTMQAAVTSSGKGSAGIRWWLIGLGAEASRESAVTQTITLTLDPVLLGADGQPGELLIDAPDALAPPKGGGNALDTAG
jgi:hypothetical protein